MLLFDKLTFQSLYNQPPFGENPKGRFTDVLVYALLHVRAGPGHCSFEDNVHAWTSTRRVS